jgi:Flp pilus assembly pilin Flp
MLMKLRGRRGQGMTEYIIIVALIAIAAIGIISLYGDNIRALFATADNALAGNEDAEAKTNEASSDLYGHKNMKDFAQRNAPDSKI